MGLVPCRPSTYLVLAKAHNSQTRAAKDSNLSTTNKTVTTLDPTGLTPKQAYTFPLEIPRPPTIKMERTIEGRVRKRLSKTTRTGRARRRELSDEDRQRLSDQAGSRPRGPNGRFLPNQHKKECTICVESKWALHFPSARISETCAHELDICLECIQNSIRADFDSKQWNEVSCPECNARLDSSAIVKYADAETFSRYGHGPLPHTPRIVSRKSKVTFQQIRCTNSPDGPAGASKLHMVPLGGMFVWPDQRAR